MLNLIESSFNMLTQLASHLFHIEKSEVSDNSSEVKREESWEK